jgi:hypothetical protein
MTAGQNKVLVRRLVEEAVNSASLDVLAEVAEGEFAVAARRRGGPFRDSFPELHDGDRRPGRRRREAGGRSGVEDNVGRTRQLGLST